MRPLALDIGPSVSTDRGRGSGAESRGGADGSRACPRSAARGSCPGGRHRPVPPPPPVQSVVRRRRDPRRCWRRLCPARRRRRRWPPGPPVRRRRRADRGRHGLRPGESVKPLYSRSGRRHGAAREAARRRSRRCRATATDEDGYILTIVDGAAERRDGRLTFVIRATEGYMASSTCSAASSDGDIGEAGKLVL